MERICVTGAGGYIASWVINLFLSKGYIVHGTVRDPSNEEKNGHLKKLENAGERLHLFKADLFDYEGLCAAFAGCSGVLHIASPVPGILKFDDPQTEILDPAILGTRNILNACLEVKVKKVVVVSSMVSAMLNPKWPLGLEMDESCWADVEYCKSNERWYALSKTLAEREALEYGKKYGLNVATICPSGTIGPMLQPTLNASSLLLLSYIKGKCVHSINKHCSACIDGVDSTDHLLICCPFARFIWDKILGWCGLPQTKFKNVKEVVNFAATWGNGTKKKKKALVTIVYGVLWCLWRARNDRIFNSCFTNPARVTDSIKSLVFVWIKHRYGAGSFVWEDWMLSPFNVL